MKTPEIAILSAHLATRNPSQCNPYRAAHDAADLSTLGKRATSLATRYCNGTIDPDKYERGQASIASKANLILQPYRLTATATGDPRGYCLKLFPMDGADPLPGNTWGGTESGYGV